MMLSFCWLGGGGGGEEGSETLPDGGQSGSGSAGGISPKGQAANLRQRLTRRQNRHQLVNKPQDFQVSELIFVLYVRNALREFHCNSKLHSKMM